jgi:hypothetical protein
MWRDQRSQGAGEYGFAAGGGASENKDGVRAGCTEGGRQPGEDEGLGGSRQIEE